MQILNLENQKGKQFSLLDFYQRTVFVILENFSVSFWWFSEELIVYQRKLISKAAANSVLFVPINTVGKFLEFRVDIQKEEVLRNWSRISRQEVTNFGENSH